jgi:hypothetical protein
MNTFKNNYDTLEHIIFEGGLRIMAVHFHVDMDLMLVVLNNKRVMRRSISGSPRLGKATVDQLNNYLLITDGVGIHWPELDEDLSLKGFLKEELAQAVDPVKL